MPATALWLLLTALQCLSLLHTPNHAASKPLCGHGKPLVNLPLPVSLRPVQGHCRSVPVLALLCFLLPCTAQTGSRDCPGVLDAPGGGWLHIPFLW